MELESAIAARRMVRAFTPQPLSPDTVDNLLDLARRAPSAGNTQAIGFVVLDTTQRRALYWDSTLAPERRESFRWPGLLAAPVLILVTTDPAAYPRRYSEPDKAAIGLGVDTEAWPVPYWWVDAGAVIQNILLLAVDQGLGACLFGPFGHEARVADAVGLDEGRRIVATIALGHPDHRADRPGRSAQRPRPPLDRVVTRP